MNRRIHDGAIELYVDVRLELAGESLKNGRVPTNLYTLGGADRKYELLACRQNHSERM